MACLSQSSTRQKVGWDGRTRASEVDHVSNVTVLIFCFVGCHATQNQIVPDRECGLVPIKSVAPRAWMRVSTGGRVAAPHYIGM